MRGRHSDSAELPGEYLHSKPFCVVVAQLGARNHYCAARVLDDAGLLHSLVTDTYLGNKPNLKRMLNSLPRERMPRVLRSLLDRDEPRITASKVHSFDFLGILYALRRSWCRTPTDLAELYAATNSKFGIRAARHEMMGADMIYSFSGTGESIFRRVPKGTMWKVLEKADCAVSIDRATLLREASEFDGWQPGLRDYLDSELPALEAAAEQEEILSSDLVIVPSDHAKKTLQQAGYEQGSIVTMPYGVDLTKFQLHTTKKTRHELHVVYIGSVDLRKGVQYLLRAAEALGSQRIKIKLIGTVALSRDVVHRYSSFVEFAGAISRDQIRDVFDWADLLVFPTLSDGFGLVQIEAMAAGVPVLATMNCGEVVRDGIEGHIIPTRDHLSIVRWLDHYASFPNDLENLRAAALARSEYFSLDAYASRLTEALQQFALDQRAGQLIDLERRGL